MGDNTALAEVTSLNEDIKGKTESETDKDRTWAAEV